MAASKPRRGSAGRKSADARPEKGHGRALAYDWLKRQIVSLELLPGSSIDETTLVEALGVSRTPLREAVVRLAAEGLIELLPNRGARVTGMDLSQIQEHLEAFELLQRAATVLATLYRPQGAIAELRQLCEAFEVAHRKGDVQGMIDANWEFHRAIGAACGNRYIERTYVGLLTEGLRISRLAMAYECYGSTAAYDAHIADILHDHRELVDVIETRDATRAATLADAHSNLARKRVTDYLGRSATRGLLIPGERAPAAARGEALRV